MPRKALIWLFALFISLPVFFAACSNKTASNNNAAPPATNPDVKDTDGFTPLMNAARNGDMDGARRSIENGSNINASNEVGITALFIAAGMGNKELTQLLIDKGANVNAKTNGGFTPLMQASLTGQVEIAKLLLDAGADPAALDIAKKNAADYAPTEKRKEISEVLKIKPALSQTPAVKVDSNGNPIKPEPKKK